MAIFQELLDSADECTIFLQNAGQHLTNNTAWQPKTLNTFQKNENILSMIRIKLHVSLDIQPIAYHYAHWAIPAHRFSEFCLKLLALFRFFMHLVGPPSQHANHVFSWPCKATKTWCISHDIPATTEWFLLHHSEHVLLLRGLKFSGM